MKDLNIDFLRRKKSASIKKPGKLPVKFFISPLAVAIVFISSFILGRISQSEAASFALAELDRLPIIGQMSHLIGSQDRKLIGEDEDRINILLIGVGGEGHDGPNLTDTLIVISLRPSDNNVALLSIPRDLLVPVPGYGWKKINSINAYGEMEALGHGGELIRTTMEGLLGIDIPYYARIDFDGFRSIIDAVEGVDIFVERSFVDYNYPTYTHGVQRISFAEGWQHFDGETALRFTRSRHGNNGEGTDFARSKRQQKVLTALKDKLMSFRTFRSPFAITNTLAALQSSIVTNLNVGEILRLSRWAREIKRENIKYQVLNNNQNSPFVDKLVNGAYVLLPRDNDWTLLREAAAKLFENAESETIIESESTTFAEETRIDSTIEIKNGNGQSGVAREVASKLSPHGFKIIKIGNANSFDYRQTIIYDLTYGRDSASLKLLKQIFPEVKVADSKTTAALTSSSGADFLIVLGRE
jgi:LCP family protein required for cell wall assembly